MEKQVSTKNTKNEILNAYEELLKKVQEQKPEDAKTKAEQKEKQKEWTEKEEEYQQLKKMVDEFPKEMDDAVKKAKEEVTKDLTTKYKFEKDLHQKETEGEIKLYKQTIQNLESKIKEQHALIEQLTKKSDYSSDQVKEIAVKAIEGASNQRFVLRDREKEESEKEK